MSEETPRQQALGLRVTYPDGSVELFRDMGGYYLDGNDREVWNPVFGPGVKVEIVLPRIEAEP